MQIFAFIFIFMATWYIPITLLFIVLGFTHSYLGFVAAVVTLIVKWLSTGIHFQ